MPYYKPLKNVSATVRKRTVDNLKDLREQLDAQLPKKNTAESLIVGTWNIRNFDDNRFNHGPRLEESFYYLAEIMSRFDVLAVQEVCRDLRPLQKLMGILGWKYDFILTDVTHKSVGGNDERLGFIFDKNKVDFRGVAGELVLPPEMIISETADTRRQFSRTPFSCLFQSGWFKFMFATVHIYFGSSSTGTPEYERRVQEISRVAEYLADEAEKSDNNYILVGDFNILRPSSRGFNAIEDNGFQVIQNRHGSNADQTKFYDQISFKARENELQIVDQERDDRVFQFFDAVFTEAKFLKYRSTIRKMVKRKMDDVDYQLANTTSASRCQKLTRKKESLQELIATDEATLVYYLKKWRTFQMSDHLPLWLELKVDFSSEYLDYLRAYTPE